MDNQIQGQLDIFQYLSSLAETVKKSNVLKAGQKLYKVVLCNIEEYVIKRFYDCGDADGFGMHLETDEGSKDCAYDRDLGVTVFESYDDAKALVTKNSRKYNIIYAKDMNVVSKKVFSYIRKCDKRKMYMYYAVLDNGYVYTKDNYTYCYLTKRSEAEALKHLMKQVEEIPGCIEETDLPEPLHNMYQCKESSSNWLYTEAKCSYVKGYDYGINE